jgi:hypothetical protein
MEPSCGMLTFPSDSSEATETVSSRPKLLRSVGGLSGASYGPIPVIPEATSLTTAWGSLRVTEGRGACKSGKGDTIF